ncbi:MAG: hypothetical protein RLO01_04160 [Thalassobaculaceae bacterium]
MAVWRLFSREASKELAIEAIRSWIWPPLFAAAVAVIGWFENLPWFYIFVGSSLGFAGLATGLLRIDEWIRRNRAENKLLFENIRVLGILDQENDKTSAIRFGFQLLNKAVFPIECKVIKVDSSLAGEYPPKKTFQKTVYDVSEGMSFFFDDYNIDLSKQINDKELEGSISFIVRYGRKGRRVHELSKKFKIVVGFSSEGKLSGASWNEVDFE